MVRKLHHVVSAAVLRRIGTKRLAQLAGFSVPRLVLARAAGRVRTLVYNLVPEVLRKVAILCVAGELVHTRRRDHLRDVRVDVQSLQSITVRQQRIVEGSLFEASRRVQVVTTSGNGRKVGKS